MKRTVDGFLFISDFAKDLFSNSGKRNSANSKKWQCYDSHAFATPKIRTKCAILHSRKKVFSTYVCDCAPLHTCEIILLLDKCIQGIWGISSPQFILGQLNILLLISKIYASATRSFEGTLHRHQEKTPLYFLIHFVLLHIFFSISIVLIFQVAYFNFLTDKQKR